MENALSLRLQNTPWIWGNARKSNSFSKTLMPKSSFNPSMPIDAFPQHNSTKHKTLLVDTYHQHQRLRELFAQLNKKGSCPLQLLLSHGDWSKDLFWPVIMFLKRSSRSSQILKVFDLWKGIEKSRSNEYNYENIVVLLSEEGLMEDASSALSEMQHVDLRPSLQIYNSIIHGYSRTGKFDDALFYLNQMKEANLMPESSTYYGMIQSYGKHKMYDEIVISLKKMEKDGCSPDQETYNLLIKEFAKAGLLTRMEKSYQALRSKKMQLLSSTMIAMLEVYVNYGVVAKMEKVMKQLSSSNVPVKEDLVRKIAVIYIENLMFSRLNDLGIYLSSRGGRSDMIWCLRLLSSSCSLSQKSMDIVVKEMKEAKFPWNVTLVNIIWLAYLKMKDFKRLRVLLDEMGNCGVKPDLVTVGIVLNAKEVGFGTLERWRKMGILYRGVEIDTDALVLAAYGKGRFVKKCEEAYLSLEPKERERKWTYCDLIDLVAKNDGKRWMDG